MLHKSHNVVSILTLVPAILVPLHSSGSRNFCQEPSASETILFLCKQTKTEGT